jgi:SSS family solute:Na+ symporter
MANAADNGITDAASLAVIKADAYPHYLDVMAILFILNIVIMLVIGKLYPRKEAFVQEYTKQVDITPWKPVYIVGGLITLMVISIYYYFS